VISPLATVAPAWIAATLLWWRAPSFTSAALTSGSAKYVVPQVLASVEGRRERARAARQALLASGLVNKTDPVTLARWCEQLTPLWFASGSVIASGGDFGGRVYVIMSGKVELSHRRRGECDVVLTFLGSHEIVGRVSLFDAAVSETFVTALTDVLLLPIERDQLLAWMTECSEFSAQMLRLFARRTKEMTYALTDFAFSDVPGRVASRLLFLKRRFGHRDGEVIRIAHDLTVKELSRLVGVSSLLIADILRDFEDRGWIHLDGTSVVIADSHALASCPNMLR
jgi:CRP/FNR family transcriptional regulator, cyclic AMP receptor protein